MSMMLTDQVFHPPNLHNEPYFEDKSIQREFMCREWVFSKLWHCVETRNQAKTCGVLVLSGPGCGKTRLCQEIVQPTVALDNSSNTLTKMTHLKSSLVAHYFCSAQFSQTLNIPRFLLSIRAQILNCKNLPLAEAYRKTAVDDSEIAQLFTIERLIESPDEALKRGILLPLLSIPAPKENKVIIVDSIDESFFIPLPTSSDCQQYQPPGSKNIAELLSTHHQFFPSWLTLICTCRKQTKSVIRLFTGFRKISLDDLRKNHVIRDVQQYILARLDSDDRLRSQLNQETADMLNLLHIKSNACFLYLESVLDGCIDGFIKPRDIAEIPGTLNGLYLWLCQRLFAKRGTFASARPIFNVILASPFPVTEGEVFRATWMRDTTLTYKLFQSRLEMLNRLLRVYESKLILFHHSFSEWLVDVKYCTQHYLCSASEGHTLLALGATQKLYDDAQALAPSEIQIFARHLVRSCLQPPIKAYHFVLWMIYSNARISSFSAGINALFSNQLTVDPTADKLLMAAGVFQTIDGNDLTDKSDNLKLSDTQISCLRSFISPQQSTKTLPVSSTFLQTSTTLCTAAYQGNASVIRLLLSQGADLTVRDKSGSSPLILASRQGHTEVVKMLVQAGMRLDHVDKDGWTALRSAAWGGHFGVVEVLLESGADPNLTGPDKRTALRAAAWGGHEAIVSLLLSHGAEVNLADIEGRTPLIAAAYMGYQSIVEMLIDAGANLNHADKDSRTALSVATLCIPSSSSQPSIVSLLLERGASVDWADREGMTPLLVAAYEGRREVCEILLEWDADVDRTDRSGRTPLLAAASCGHASVVQIILFWGAAIHCMDGEGRSVLSIAVAQGNPDVVLELLARGLDEMHRDNAGMTPLHIAAYEGNLDVVRILVDAGARTAEHDNQGRTPLLLACQQGHMSVASFLMQVSPHSIDIAAHDGRTPLRCSSLEDNQLLVQHLLARGADPNKQDAYGRTTLYMVCLDGLLPMLELLLTFGRGTDPSLSDEEGRSPLHVAAWQGHLEVTTVLIRAGAFVEARDREGRTPLQSAAWQGHAQLCQLLIDCGARVDMGCSQGATALCIAAQEGHLSVCNVLLQSGANPNHADAYGRTPHRVAFKAGHQAVCRLLEDYGASPSASLLKSTVYSSAGATGNSRLMESVNTGPCAPPGMDPGCSKGFWTTPPVLMMANEKFVSGGVALMTMSQSTGGSSNHLTNVTPLQQTHNEERSSAAINFPSCPSPRAVLGSAVGTTSRVYRDLSLTKQHGSLRDSQTVSLPRKAALTPQSEPESIWQSLEDTLPGPHSACIIDDFLSSSHLYHQRTHPDGDPNHHPMTSTLPGPQQPCSSSTLNNDMTTLNKDLQMQLIVHPKGPKSNGDGDLDDVFVGDDDDEDGCDEVALDSDEDSPSVPVPITADSSVSGPSVWLPNVSQPSPPPVPKRQSKQYSEQNHSKLPSFKSGTTSRSSRDSTEKHSPLVDCYSLQWQRKDKSSKKERFRRSGRSASSQNSHAGGAGAGSVGETSSVPGSRCSRPDNNRSLHSNGYSNLPRVLRETSFLDDTVTSGKLKVETPL